MGDTGHAAVYDAVISRRKRVNIRELRNKLHSFVDHKLSLYNRSAKDPDMRSSESSSRSETTTAIAELTDNHSQQTQPNQSWLRSLSEQRFRFKVASLSQEHPTKQSDSTSNIIRPPNADQAKARVLSKSKRMIREKIQNERAKLDRINAEIERLQKFTKNMVAKKAGTPDQAYFEKNYGCEGLHGFEKLPNFDEISGFPNSPRSPTVLSLAKDCSISVSSHARGEGSCCSFIFEDDSPSEPSETQPTVTETNLVRNPRSKSFSTCSQKSASMRMPKAIPLLDHSTYLNLCRGGVHRRNVRYA